MPIPAACQAISDRLEELKAERTDLQLELQQAATGEKAGLARQIKALIRLIAVEDARLTDCLATQPSQPPPPPPLASTLSAVVTLTTSNPQAPGPFQMPLDLGVILDGPRQFIAVTSFPDIATAFDTPVGRNTTTVSKIAGGSGSHSAGAINVPVTLHFDQSIDLPFFEEDSDLALTLSTVAPGSPVGTNGAVILSGTGTFIGGFLAGATGTVSIDGAFSPVP